MMATEKEAALGADMSQFATFRLHERLFGVDIQDVKEINTEMDLTQISHASNFVRGLVNIRGQVYAILDLRVMMGYPRNETVGKDNKLLIFKQRVGENFGVLVDDIGDIVTIDKNSIKDRRQNNAPPPEGVDRRGSRDQMVVGVAQMEQDLLMVLRSSALLDQVEVQHVMVDG